MTDRKIFDLFYGAREGDDGLCRRAYETGADINFAFEGRRGAKGSAGRWYYGDLQWYAPDGTDGEKKDTLLMIAIKVNNAKLAEWILSLDGLDTSRTNAKGLDAMAVAKATGRGHLLLGMAVTLPRTDNMAAASGKGAKGTAPAGVVPPPPPPGGKDDTDAKELVRLGNAIKMLKTQNEQQEAEIAKAQKDCETYRQMLKEKDADIGELQKSVLEREREVIVMLHKIGQLEEALRSYTDFRQADAEQFVEWGQADYHNAERDKRPEADTQG